MPKVYLGPVGSQLRVLVTGGAGFIGSQFVREMLASNVEVVNLDKLTYAGNLNNLTGVLHAHGHTFVRGDICSKTTLDPLVKGVDAVVNFAAETHVDRSIRSGDEFLRTDIFGLFRVLEAVRRYDKKLLQVSTDEVYGSTLDSFAEADSLSPSSPYSASKAAGDLLVHAYRVTYGIDVLVTRSSNNYGPRQHPEKMIPLFITNALQGKGLPVYGDGENVRDWLFVEDNCDAIALVLTKGSKGEIYNVGSGSELRNITVAKRILATLHKPESLINFVEDRLGHDRRYSLNCEKIRQLGWAPKVKFETGLKRTIDWYRQNPGWWKPLSKIRASPISKPARHVRKLRRGSRA